MSLLEVTNLSHAYGDKVLYEDASFALQRGEHMGVVGQNGAGKSTLLSLLTGEIVPDQGDIRWQADVRIGHLDQYAKTDDALTIEDYLNTAFSELFELERRMNGLYERYASSLDERDLERAEHCRAQLESRGLYEAQTRVARVSEGLGLSALGRERRLGALSGGQRAKVILAKLLLVQPDVLLLDEPTNFLDKEHVAWLSGYLGTFPGAFIVVSHDDAFLARISACILDVEGGRFASITAATGNSSNRRNICARIISASTMRSSNISGARRSTSGATSPASTRAWRRAGESSWSGWSASRRRPMPN